MSINQHVLARGGFICGFICDFIRHTRATLARTNRHEGRLKNGALSSGNFKKFGQLGRLRADMQTHKAFASESALHPTTELKATHK